MAAAYPDRGRGASEGRPIPAARRTTRVRRNHPGHEFRAKPGGMTQMRRLATTPKLMASLAVLGAAASIAGLGTFATFTSSTSAQNQALTSGTVSITLGAANRLTTGASNLVPGDTVERAVDITNNGSAGTSQVGSITLTTTASPSSLLDTDTTNGLQMQIDSCSVAWTES